MPPLIFVVYVLWLVDSIGIGMNFQYLSLMLGKDSTISTVQISDFQLFFWSGERPVMSELL